MSNCGDFSRMRAAYPIGKMVQLAADLGRIGRNRVGKVTGHHYSKVLVNFITEPERAIPCQPFDLEDASPGYLTETSMNVLSDTLDDIRVQYLEQRNSRHQVENDEEEMRALYNRTARA